MLTLGARCACFRMPIAPQALWKGGQCMRATAEATREGRDDAV